MDAGLLDVLHHARDDDLFTVAQRIDITLDGVAQVLVDQHRRITRHLHCSRDVVIQLRHAVDDLHRAAAQHIAGTDQHGEADAVRHRHGLIAAAGNAIGRLLEVQFLDQGGEPLTVFSQVDRVG